MIDLNLPDVLRLFAFIAWMLGMAFAMFSAWTLVQLLRTGRLLRIKRLMLIRNIALVLLGIIPALARLFVLRGQAADDIFLALASLMAALMYPVASIIDTLILRLDPYDPRNNE